MKVVHVPRRFSRDDWGGTETVILNTIRGLRSHGVDGEIVTTTALAPLADEDVQGVRVRRFDYFYPFFGLDESARRDMDRKGGNLFSFSLLRALLADREVSVLHAHTGKRLGGIVRLAARLKGIPYVVSLHGGHLDIPEAELDTLAAPRRRTVEWGKVLGMAVGSRRVLDDASAILCVGRGEHERMRDAFPGKPVLYVPNGVDTAAFEGGDGHSFRRTWGIGDDERLILTVGRLDPQKNQSAVIGAMTSVLGRFPRARLVLVGPVTIEAYHQELRAQVARLGLASRVVIIPGYPVGDRRLIDAFAAADLFVLPSRHEPFGIVILEAWSAGLPVVASRVGGIPGVIDDGRTGLLVEPESVPELANAIGGLLSDPGRAAALADAGRREAKERYEWSQVCGGLAGLYRELVGEGGARAGRRGMLRR